MLPARHGVLSQFLPVVASAANHSPSLFNLVTAFIFDLTWAMPIS